MIESLIRLLFLVIATERITELLVESKIFEPLRMLVKRWAYDLDAPPSDSVYQHFKVMLSYLTTCGYCVSVWVAFATALLAPSLFDYSIVNWFIMSMVIHGLANLYHVLYELMRRGRVRSIDITYRRSSEADGV